MAQHMADINLIAIKVNRRNQSILVPADVENYPFVYHIGRRKNGTQFGKSMEICFLHDLEPACERSPTIRVFFPKLDQRFAGYNVHSDILSQIEIKNKELFSLFLTPMLFMSFVVRKLRSDSSKTHPSRLAQTACIASAGRRDLRNAPSAFRAAIPRPSPGRRFPASRP